MAPKKILLASVGAIFLSLILFLGFRSTQQAALPQSQFKFLADVSESVNPGSAKSATAPTEIGEVDTRDRSKAEMLARSSKSAPVNQVCTFATTQKPARTPILINEVAWMGSAKNANQEWIELKNIFASAVDISSWQLLDEKEQIHITIPDKMRFKSDALLLLERGDEAVPGITAHQIYTGALANSSEGLRLFDAGCNLIDEVLASPSWPAGDSASKRTMERDAVNSWHTYSESGSDGIFGTPLKENSLPGQIDEEENLGESAPAETPATPTSTPAELTVANSVPTSTTPTSTENAAAEPAPNLLPIFISEIMVGTEASTTDEFIELYNQNEVDVVLTGYTIKKKSSSGSESALVAASRLEGKIIKAKKHLLIGHEGGYSGSVAADLTWPASYALAYKNNAVVLYDASGQAVHEVSWIEIFKGQSLICSAANVCVSSLIPTPENSQ